jgi:hypothetical protein
MGVMDDTIEDGVSDRWFADHLVPLRDGKLGGDQSGFPAVALFEDFQEIEPLSALIVSARSHAASRRAGPYRRASDRTP